MGIKHFSHPEHTLNLVDSIEESKVPNCNGCFEVMSFPGYACESAKCKFYLHKSCTELPPKILHPLHPHPLTCNLTNKALICDGCRDLYGSCFTFSCSWCGFNLDAKCASKQDQEYHQTFKELTLFRFYHKHALKLCNVPKFIVARIPCCCCRQIISAGSSAYCCIECGIIIHGSCTEIPMEVHHPFHRQHILLTQPMDNKSTECDACKSSIEGIKIGCNECDFDLHVSCANPNRWACALKHLCHEHNMYYFVEDDTTGSFECNKCHEKCLDDEAFYRCVECDFNLHLRCIPIPSVVTVTQKHHHPLTLIDSVKEDNSLIQYIMDSNDKVDYSMDYYCDDCETPGNPKLHAYCCKECNYIAHVECIISKKDTPLEIPSNLNPTHGIEPKKEHKMSDEVDFHPAESDHNTEQAAQNMSKKNGATTSLDSKCKDNEQLFSHPSHPDHKLTLLQQELTNGGLSGEEIKYCDGCNEVMCFPGYACHHESAKCKFYLHKSCAELPPKILHPLHPHPLTCSTLTDDDEGLICDGCRDLYGSGFNFRCSWCGFNLDAKCASKQDQEYHKTFKKLTLYRFYHKHALKLCNVPKTEHPKFDEPIPCCCCSQIISTGSSAYCCIECGIIIHESCTEIPMEIHHPFHSQHILLTQAIDKDDYWSCAACKSLIDGIEIGCNMCKFHLHVSCANPNRCALKHKCHEHNMYYFVKDDTMWSFECNKCHEKCLDDEAFYRCVECDFNLHLKCIPIPSVVMITQRHSHPLTLIDSVKEDNPLVQYLMDSNDKVDHSMDYYCDICETPGNPKHHAYCCKECIYIAHVECIISKDNTSLEILSNLNPTHGTEQNNTSDE